MRRHLLLLALGSACYPSLHDLKDKVCDTSHPCPAPYQCSPLLQCEPLDQLTSDGGAPNFFSVNGGFEAPFDGGWPYGVGPISDQTQLGINTEPAHVHSGLASLIVQPQSGANQAAPLLIGMASAINLMDGVGGITTGAIYCAQGYVDDNRGPGVVMSMRLYADGGMSTTAYQQWQMPPPTTPPPGTPGNFKFFTGSVLPTAGWSGHVTLRFASDGGQFYVDDLQAWATSDAGCQFRP